MLEANHSRWANSHVMGLNSIVLADTQLGIALYDTERHHAHTYDYGGHDTGVCAYGHRAVTLWISGFPDQAAQMAEAALELGHRVGHPPACSTRPGGRPRSSNSFAHPGRVANFRN